MCHGCTKFPNIAVSILNLHFQVMFKTNLILIASFGQMTDAVSAEAK